MQEILGYFQEWLENSEESMENFTSEKEIIMIPFVPSEAGDFHIRKTTRTGGSTSEKREIAYIKVKGKEDMLRKCSACYQFFTADSFPLNGTKNANGHSYLYQACKTCYKKIRKERRYVAKNAPPRPDECDCCNLKTDKLTIDHKHGTRIFRGFLCNTCNIGHGFLGDTLEGVLRAAIYLENDKDKIIETLNKVKEGSADV